MEAMGVEMVTRQLACRLQRTSPLLVTESISPLPSRTPMVECGSSRTVACSRLGWAVAMGRDRSRRVDIRLGVAWSRWERGTPWAGARER